MTDWTDQDRRFMTEALELAARGRGFTSPNPRVGAVLVRDGAVVGRGYHHAYGEAHAEVNAIADAGGAARGADLYVTLEPCCVWGNTPPCTEAVIAAGIRRVVTPMTDPNPDVAGTGLRELRDAGVSVELGCLREEALRLNAPYVRFRETGLPLVTLKLAVTLDGRITGGGREDRWISGEESRREVHAMRAVRDAVLVGVGTVLADDPELTDRRDAAAARQPVRIVADSRLRTPVDAGLVRSAREVPTVIACLDDGTLDAPAAGFEDTGVTVWRLPAGPSGSVDAVALAKRMAAEGMTDILCEGGATLGTALLENGIATRLAVFLAPKLAGDSGLAALGTLTADVHLEETRWERVGSDVLMTADVTRAPACGTDGTRAESDGDGSTGPNTDRASRETTRCSRDS